MRVRIFTCVAAALLITLLPLQNAHAKCVQVALLDNAGKVIMPGGLVVGLKVGDTPIFNVPMPVHREQKEIRDMPCPQDLTSAVLDLYNRACTSDTARQQMAVNRDQNVEIIRKRCGELREALNISE